MGLIVDIYKDRHGDSSNGGLSAWYSQVTVVNVDGPFEPSRDAPAVEVVPGNLPGLLKAVPVDGGEGAGPMFGGTFIYTSDSRLRAVSEYPIPLHDRWESWELYERMSR